MANISNACFVISLVQPADCDNIHRFYHNVLHTHIYKLDAESRILHI